MKLQDLFEAKAPPAGVDAVEKWVETNVQLTPFLKKKNASTFSSTPYRVWTRGDGARYKDPPFIEFSHKEYIDLAWDELMKLPHENTTLIGPFGSTKRDAVIIGQNILVKDGVRLNVYRKASILASKVMSIDSGTENLLLSIIEKKLQGGKPIRIGLIFNYGRDLADRVVGTIKSIDDRELTIDKDDGSIYHFRMPYDADARYTIKDNRAGIPTLVKK